MLYEVITILYVVTKMTVRCYSDVTNACQVNIYSGSLIIQEALGWSLWPAVTSILALSAICTLTGGLTAVIYLDIV